VDPTLKTTEDERKRSEAALRESEERFRATFEHAPVGIAHVGLDGRFLRINQRFCDIVGYSCEEMLARTFQEITHPGDLEGDLEYVRRMLAGDIATYSIEKRYIRKDGTLVPVQLTVSLLRDTTGRPRHFISAIEDLSERKRAEQALRESEQRLRLGLEGANVGIWDWDILTGEIVFVGHWGEILGYEPAEIEHYIRMWQGSIHPEDKSRVMQALEDHFQGKTPFYEAVHRLRAKSGEWRWMLGRGKVIDRDKDGRPLRAIGMHMDVTEQHRFQEALHREQRTLRQLLELQERERQLITYEIHDGFTQEVTGAMMQFQAFLGLKQADPAEAQKAFGAGMQLLRASVAEARRLINGLRPAVLDESGIVAAIENLVSEGQQPGAARIEFSHDVRFRRLAPPLENTLFRIAQESLNNAARHSQSPVVFVRLLELGDRVRLEIEDQGIGFDTGSVPPERFGLQSIRERARLFGGETTIRSAPGKGTQVAVDLPLIEIRRPEGDE